jgi:hypothetical protein
MITTNPSPALPAKKKQGGSRWCADEMSVHWMLPQRNQDPERNNCPPPVSAVLSGFVRGELEGG